MGYHTIEIKKGKLEEFSKIEEEFLELKDAHQQSNSVLEICELCDLIGAVELYARKYNLTLNNLILMKNKTTEAFQEGKRKNII